MKQGVLNNGLRQFRRVFIALFGFTVLAIGLALTVLPGPAFVVIPLGFAILASEFVWAKKTLQRMKEEAERLKEKLHPNGKV